MTTVLHLRSGHGLYGADRALLAIAQATPPPFRPVVGSIVRGADALGEEARRLGLPAVTLRSTGKLDAHLVSSVREQRPALIHAHDFKSLFLAVSSACAPVVATYHGETAVTRSVRAYELFARVLGNFTRGAVAVSRPLQDTLTRWVRFAPVSFVPNALPARPPPSDEERLEARRELGLDGYVIAVIGRLSREKGQHVLLEAAPAEATVVFAGEGPERAALEGRGARLLGFVKDPRRVFAAADVIAIPSLTEGLPLVALEALAARRCLVASAVGELPELLRDGAGLLVPPGDARALGEALRKASDPAVRAACTARGAERLRAYDVSAMADAYARCYRAALGEAEAYVTGT